MPLGFCLPACLPAHVMCCVPQKRRHTIFFSWTRVCAFGLWVSTGSLLIRRALPREFLLRKGEVRSLFYDTVLGLFADQRDYSGTVLSARNIGTPHSSVHIKIASFCFSCLHKGHPSHKNCGDLCLEPRYHCV